MGKIITIDPVTRISGFMEIQVEVDQNAIIDAKCSGLLFRGFEKMLIGRQPTDATYFTERICGICSTAHGVASTMALENAMKVQVSVNDRYIRDIMHGFEYIQNHLRHFYQLVLPDYIKIKSLPLAGDQIYSDFRMPDDVSKLVEQHYIESIQFSRLSHEGLAVLGGKAPHAHGVFLGGVTVSLDDYKLEKVISLIDKLKNFVTNVMKEDMGILADYYSDYYQKGNSYPNFMSYGFMDSYEEKDLTYVKPGVIINGVGNAFVPNSITEQIKYSWYLRDQNGETVDMSKSDAYTFIKSPQYQGFPMEVGPLARLMINGEYTRGNSCMDRIAARVLETEKVLTIMRRLAEKVQLLPNNLANYPIPEAAEGAGFIDTTRGALAHWTQVKGHQISHYNIITPSVWNLSPKNDSGQPGVVEKALIGTSVNNINEPIEIGRIIRSYDPCVSCATHVLGPGLGTREMEFGI